MSKEFELTRRRILAGLGTVGAAGAAAGMGTSAFLNDEESYENNMITAGSLDLKVEYVVHEHQGSAGSYTINSFNNTVNGETAGVPALNGDGTAMSQTLKDVKPGDHGHSAFCFNIVDNPAYLWAFGDLNSSTEHGYTEPEPEDNNGEGELEEAIQVEVKYCDINAAGSLVEGEGTMFSGTLREALDKLSDGMPLDGKSHVGVDPTNRAPYDASSPTASNPCFCIDWEVPTSVGNIIQGDSVSFDLGFYAEQARHNDNPTTPANFTD